MAFYDNSKVYRLHRSNARWFGENAADLKRSYERESVMPNEQTEKALDEITRWARELAAGGSPDGGVNITFAIAREGSHTITNAFLTEGDCTPFPPVANP